MEFNASSFSQWNEGIFYAVDSKITLRENIIANCTSLNYPTIFILRGHLYIFESTISYLSAFGTYNIMLTKANFTMSDTLFTANFANETHNILLLEPTYTQVTACRFISNYGSIFMMGAHDIVVEYSLFQQNLCSFFLCFYHFLH